MKILVLNSGSSSVKFQIIETDLERSAASREGGTGLAMRGVFAVESRHGLAVQIARGHVFLVRQGVVKR